MAYDSADDTYAHIEKVRHNIVDVTNKLLSRGVGHDASKLIEPEKSVFDKVTPLLKSLTYGSEEYQASLDSMGTALTHHYESNRHHPEHYEQGINDMTLIDIMEMLCDWKAAAERHEDGDILESLHINSARFNIDPQLSRILENTVYYMSWQRR